jgi:hypothetical protein
MNKRVITAMLVGLNFVLLLSLLLTAYSPPAAVAQAVARTDEYMLLSAEAELNSDVLYLLDLNQRQLHAFRVIVPRGGQGPIQVGWVNMRDLIRDFRR